MRDSFSRRDSFLSRVSFSFGHIFLLLRSSFIIESFLFFVFFSSIDPFPLRGEAS